jgi:hypothetical protein
VLKAYTLGFVIAALAVLLVSFIWLSAQPPPEPGLLWGNNIYTTKQQFEGYLKEKGLSYKTWAAKNPNAAPWEPRELTVGAITVRATTQTRDTWVIRGPLAALGLMLATAGTLLLLRWLVPVIRPPVSRGGR